MLNKSVPPRRILVISTRQFGDALLITPLLRSLKQTWPQAVLDVLTFRGKEIIFQGNADIAELIITAEHPTWREYLSLFKRIARRYDLAVSTQAGDRPLLYALFAAPRRAAPLPRRDKQSAWKHLLIQHKIINDPHCHVLRRHLNLARVLGATPCYEVIPPAHPAAAQNLDTLLGRTWREEAYAVLHPAPLWRYKRWHATGWRSVVRELHRRGLRIFISGGPDAEEQTYISQTLGAEAAHCEILAGRVSFAELALLLSRCALYLGPDTAVSHLAAACGAPCVVLYGPSNPQEWSPWPRGFARDGNPFVQRGSVQQVNNVTLIQGPGDCVPCHREGCEQHRASHSRCLDELDVQQVLKVLPPERAAVDSHS